MQGKNNNSQPPSICNKLFNFFINNLIARGLKRVTLGPPVPQGSTEFPSGDSAMSSAKPTEEKKVHPQSQEKPKDNSGSEIQVQFKQTEGLENWTPVDKLGSSVHGPEKGSPIVTSDQAHLPKIDNIALSSSTTAPVKDQVSKDEVTYEMEIPLISVNGVSQGQVRMDSTIPGKGSGKGLQEVESNATTAISDNLTPERIIALEPEEPKPKPHRGPLLDVIPNINKISEEFIRKKRDKMEEDIKMEEKIS